MIISEGKLVRDVITAWNDELTHAADNAVDTAQATIAVRVVLAAVKHAFIAAEDPAVIAGRLARMEESVRCESWCVAHRRRVRWIPAPGWWIHDRDRRTCPAMLAARAPAGIIELEQTFIGGLPEDQANRS